jgi:hypothetical protein
VQHLRRTPILATLSERFHMGDSSTYHLGCTGSNEAQAGESFGAAMQRSHGKVESDTDVMWGVGNFRSQGVDVG